MNGKLLLEELEAVYPRRYAEKWDNPGLQAGIRDKEIRKVYIALDASLEAIEGAVAAGADLLLTHHPMVMSGIKSVTGDDPVGNRLLRLLSGGVASYAMHTNYDIVMMAPLSAQMIGLSDAEILTVTGLDPNTGQILGFGRIGSLPRKMTLEECAGMVKETFHLDSVRIWGDPDTPIERAAISPGSGKSMIMDAIGKKAQVLISGDFGHHEGLDAVDQGLALIDAGHYGLEHIFIDQMAGFFAEQFPEIEVVKAPVRHPFRTV